MIAATMVLLRGWLDDADYGVNAQLAALPTIPGFTNPTSVTVADQISNSQVAVGRPTKNLPMIGLTFQGFVDLEPTVAVQFLAGKPAFLVRYHGEASRAQEVVFESFQVMEAVRKCFHHFFQLADSSERQLAGIQILQLVEMSIGAVQAEVEGEPVTAGMLVVPQVHNITP